MKAELEAFVLRHGRALAGRAACFAEWLALFAEDGVYWAPTLPGPGVAAGGAAVAFLRAQGSARDARRAHLRAKPDMHAQTPASRAVHHVKRGRGLRELEARSALLVAEWRAGEARWFAGRVLHSPAARGRGVTHRPEARGSHRQRWRRGGAATAPF